VFNLQRVRHYFLIEGWRPEDQPLEKPSFGERLISFKTMEPPLRVLGGLAFSQLVVAALLIAVKDLPVGEVWFTRDRLPNPAGMHISIVALTACILFVLFGLALATTGYFLAHRAARVWIAALGLPIVISVQPSLLALWLVFAIAAVLVRIYYVRFWTKKLTPWLLWPILMLVTGSGIVTFWLLKRMVFITTFALAIATITICLWPLIMLAGTDWAEIFDTAGEWLASKSTQNKAAWGAAVAALAVIEVLILAHRHGWGLLWGMPEVIFGILVLRFVLRVAHFPAHWPTHLPKGSVILTMVGGLIAFPAGSLMLLVAPGWLAVVAAVLGVVVAPFVLLIILSRRARLTWLLPVLLFLVVMDLLPLCSVYGMSKITPSDSGIIQGRLFTSFYFLDGPLLLAAVLSIVIPAKDLRARRPAREVIEHLRTLFVLSTSVLGVYWLGSFVYQKAITAGESFRPALAAIVLIALTWDTLVSGHEITNVDGTLFPRRSRVLLFFGYISLAATTVLFWVSLKFTPGEELFGILSNLEGIVQFGLATLAPTLLVTLFILRLRPTFARDQQLPQVDKHSSAKAVVTRYLVTAALIGTVVTFLVVPTILILPLRMFGHTETPVTMKIYEIYGVVSTLFFLIIGIPMLGFYKWRGWVSWRRFAAGGVLVAILGEGFLMSPFLGPNRMSPALALTTISVIAGLCAGTVLWAVGRGTSRLLRR
jgi:hypothetical protein